MQKALVFNQREILVVTHEGKQYVSVRHVCDALEIPFQTQHEKLKVSPEFSCQVILTAGADGKTYKMFCILAEHAHLWVAGISAAKITNPERQKQFIAYKHECAGVLHEHFVNKGEDFLGIAQQLKEFRAEINQKLDSLLGVADTVFGDDKDEIQSLVQDVADLYKVDGRTVWGWIQSELDVQSYKRQNRKVINFLKNKLGKGLTLVCNK